MDLPGFVRQRRWSTVFGYLLFLGAMAGGYFYNLTFIQLGLVDLGTRVIGLPTSRVAWDLAVLAAATLVVALGAGFLLHRRGWSGRFLAKLRVLFIAVTLQTALTAVAPLLRNEAQLVTWVVLASVALGLGVPSMFGLTCDLVTVRDRGWMAAVAVSATYLPAAVYATDWRIDRLAGQLLWVIVPGLVALAVLAFVPLPLTAALARQSQDPRFGRGRFTAPGKGLQRTPRAFVVALLLMFGVYFVDSLGFLRIIDMPLYVGSAWHSPNPTDRWLIGAAHVLAAVLAGILYPALPLRALFGWVYALFALVQLQYAVSALIVPELPVGLGLPMLYAVAVSIYTVLNFVLWADFSTPDTIARNTALGVGIAGWLASFLSTSLSISWRAGDMGFGTHLQLVAAISLSLLVISAVLLLWPTRSGKAS